MAYSNALVEVKNVDKNTHIEEFTHILPGANIGEDCNPCDQTIVENDVVVRNRMTIKKGAQLWDGITLEGSIFVPPNAVYTNEKLLLNKQFPESFKRVLSRKGASVGANAAILPALIIGQCAMKGVEIIETNDVPDGELLYGNPAKSHDIENYLAQWDIGEKG